MSEPIPHDQPDSDHARLDEISTHWSVVLKAHGEPELHGPARIHLLYRYRAAVFRYLRAVVRDVSLAEELSQQVALKFLQGEFHRANPQRGRFRDYLKTVLVNLVRQHFRSPTNRMAPLPQEVADQDIERLLERSELAREWREEALQLTWKSLQSEWPTYFNLLRLRIDNLTLSSRELAERFTEQYGQSMTAANVRKTLERAHGKFADLLVRETAASLDEPTVELLRQELEELDLLKYCRPAVERWTGRTELPSEAD